MARAEMRDPAVLRQFITTLQAFNKELDARSRNLTGHWTSLQQVWRDQQAARFAADWDVTMRSIQRYLGESSTYVNHLHIKLKQVEDEYNR